ncbi:hypothetical protein AX16_000732 [Volvariella volvacea WC 439]|nr:hypothetical protein AX16_000732 [Volvariella volvacea WC 439]
MVGKNAKKAPTKQFRVITDYFLRSSPFPSSSQTPRSASVSTTSAQSLRLAPTRSDTKSVPTRSESGRIPEVVISRGSGSSMAPHSKSSRLMASTSTTSHRNVLLDTQNSTVARAASTGLKPPSRSSTKRKPMSDSDSETNYIPSKKAGSKAKFASYKRGLSHISPSPTKAGDTSYSRTSSASFKRRRVSPPLSIGAASVAGELVPTSQADEVEFTPVYQLSKDIQSIDAWRRQATLPSPEPPESMLNRAPSLMHVDHTETATTSSKRASSLSDDMLLDDSAATPGTPNSLFSLSVSPPPTSDCMSLPTPETPAEQDPVDEAAQIIAKIKARAQAAASSSPEPERLEFKEVLDDSDDEDLLPGTFLFTGKQSSNANSSTRHNTRGNSPPSPLSADTPQSSSSRSESPPPTRAQRSTRTRAPPSRAPVVLTKAPPATRGVSRANPLDALLKEKRVADKKGKGSEALRRAKSVANETDSELDSNFEEASVSSSEEGDQRLELEEHDKALLGDEQFTVVNNILQKDAAGNLEAHEGPKRVGVPFWRALQPSMDVQVSMIVPELGDHSMVLMFRSALLRGAYSHAAMLLDTGVYAAIPISQPFLALLLDLALSSVEEQLSASAYRALMQILSVNDRPPPLLPFSRLLEIVVKLGVETAVLINLGWNRSHHVALSIESHQRAIVSSRIMCIVALLSRKGCMEPREIPDTTLLLLLVALDPQTPHDVHVDTIIAVNTLCSFLAQQVGAQEIEVAVCNKVLAYISPMEPVNQAYLLSFLTSGTGTARRVASWIANSVLIGRSTITTKEYTTPPPLTPVYDTLLQTQHGGPFAVNADTDYIDMGYHVQLLSAALYDIESYVAEERAQSPGKGTTKESKLKLLKEAIDTLHEKIEDTQAAHLDRTRTKEALHTIAVRIHYQSQAATRNIGYNKRQIHSYFRPQASSS